MAKPIIDMEKGADGEWRAGPVRSFFDEQADALLGAIIELVAEERYGVGTEIRFKTDGSLVGMSGETEWAGMVNDKPVYHQGELFIPVWCQRVGKDATTMMVNTKNIVMAAAGG